MDGYMHLVTVGSCNQLMTSLMLYVPIEFEFKFTICGWTAQPLKGPQTNQRVIKALGAYDDSLKMKLGRGGMHVSFEPCLAYKAQDWKKYIHSI